MKYQYENLSPEQFEKLIIFLCQKLLGISVKGFSKGPDGGRDATFLGTAELHPSKASPWKGTTIIQAKHTNACCSSFSDSKFYSSKSPGSTIIGKEVLKIKKLRDNKELDNYMLFSNRKLAADANIKITNYLAKECRIDKASIYLCGLEMLEILLKRFPDVAENADLNPIDGPLIVSPDDLSEVIQAFVDNKSAIKEVSSNFNRTNYKQKNELNNMTDEYAEKMMKMFLLDSESIELFLSIPDNEKILELYNSAAGEFNLKIIAKRKDYQTFDNVMNYIVDLLFGRDPILSRNKKLTRAVLFYMYWHCDIGTVADA